ncbi:twin-arginine translocase subunit TatC [Alkalicella caledoniensis]|uniref:Sec-independent protein translocase protein TatC n=1 Tax=Alkalicella caledoniensis TaxID=2731377 RepID=A0A7G9W9K2_ALKCA|nr:twin-arginine translocase subunit TatC [Alkalicella caledoniensis]QNO15364.1 twin-arginine translocase subunit TatC [Alkalicella caledoniensis]
MFKKRSNQVQEKEMTLVGHLAELRKRIIYSAIFFLLSAVFCYNFSTRIINEIVDIAKDVEFIFIAPAELFMSHIKLALTGGLIISLPFLTFQIWLFVVPGMKKREKRYILLSLFMGGMFFVAGAVFAYMIVIPIILKFFIGFQTDAIKPMITFSNYLNFIFSTILSFGAVFELPIVMILLTRFGILKVSFLKKSRKYIILIIIVLSALLTPPDIISQILLSGPMILLAEFGILLSSLVEKKKKE